MGLNEFSGYFAVAGSALATGLIAAQYGLRPQPFHLGVAFAVLGLGLGLSMCRARDRERSTSRGASRA